MKLVEWLNKWKMSKLKINAHFIEMEINFNDADKKAAWEMYIELLTRVTTQNLKSEEGDEQTALTSVFKLFDITRDIIKRYGSECFEFTKIAIVILNQIIRPFTAKWHRSSLAGEFDKKEKCELFRNELIKLQSDLCQYTKMLSDISQVEDLTDLELIDLQNSDN